MDGDPAIPPDAASVTAEAEGVGADNAAAIAEIFEADDVAALLENNVDDDDDDDDDEDNFPMQTQKEERRGRKKGSKNKPKDPNVLPKERQPGSGRPKGTKNKPRDPTAQEHHGRPKGSKNKPREFNRVVEGTFLPPRSHVLELVIMQQLSSGSPFLSFPSFPSYMSQARYIII
jgi:hypothetical protein